MARAEPRAGFGAGAAAAAGVGVHVRLPPETKPRLRSSAAQTPSRAPAACALLPEGRFARSESRDRRPCPQRPTQTWPLGAGAALGLQGDRGPASRARALPTCDRGSATARRGFWGRGRGRVDRPPRPSSARAGPPWKPSPRACSGRRGGAPGTRRPLKSPQPGPRSCPHRCCPGLRGGLTADPWEPGGPLSAHRTELPTQTAARHPPLHRPRGSPQSPQIVVPSPVGKPPPPCQAPPGPHFSAGPSPSRSSPPPSRPSPPPSRPAPPLSRPSSLPSPTPSPSPSHPAPPPPLPSPSPPLPSPPLLPPPAPPPAALTRWRSPVCLPSVSAGTSAAGREALCPAPRCLPPPRRAPDTRRSLNWYLLNTWEKASWRIAFRS